MRRTMMMLALTLAVLSPAGAEPGPAEDQVLLLRHALLVGGRDASEVPIGGEMRSAEELAGYLVGWEPGEESEEIRDLFALDGLTEVVRQALVLPRTVNLITGPSKTVDIEQTIHEGAHGPRRFHVILVAD